MSIVRWRRLGLRREVLLLLPLALLTLVLLSTFSLFAYRHSLMVLLEDRQRDAEILARETALRLAEAPALSPTLLEQLAPNARRIAVVDELGRLVSASEPFDGQELLAPVAGLPAGPVAVGPNADVADVTAGFAPLVRSGRNMVVRVDLPADRLAGQLRGLGILSWVVLPVNFLVVGLVFLFLRYVLKPFDALLEQARRVDEEDPSSQDEVAFLIGTFKRAVAALAQSETAVADDIASLQRTLMPSFESGLLLLDSEARILALNKVGCDLLAIDEPAVGAPLGETLVGYPELLEILGTAVDDGGGLARREVRIQTGERHQTLGLTVHALRRDDGATRGFLVLFVDLTEVRRQADEERLAEGLAQLGELAAGVAHELRNSLATLRGYLTLVERRPEQGDLGDYLSEMRRESDHLARVVEDFLTFARPESAQVEEVELVELVRRAAADPALGAGTVTVETSDLDTARIKGDPQLLERAVRNLLHNAVRAAREVAGDTGVVCRLRRHNADLELAIEDRGLGLPETVRQRLFQPFVTTHADGVGLGLSLAHRIVGLHGGNLRLEDRREGGTRALITFSSGTSVT